MLKMTLNLEIDSVKQLIYVSVSLRVHISLYAIQHF